MQTTKKSKNIVFCCNRKFSIIFLQLQIFNLFLVDEVESVSLFSEEIFFLQSE